MAFVVKRRKECHFEYLRGEYSLLLKNINKYFHKSHKIQCVRYYILAFLRVSEMTSVKSKTTLVWSQVDHPNGHQIQDAHTYHPL